MSRFIIRGGQPLQGSLTIGGSKNSALAIMAAATLAHGECVLENVPKQSDVWTMAMILRSLGAEVWFDSADRLHINGVGISRVQAPYELVRRMRASFYVAGVLLLWFCLVDVTLHGVCLIG